MAAPRSLSEPNETEKEAGEILTLALEGHSKASGEELARRKGA